ncbi:MAG: hypothetical protein ACFE0Q_17475 [Anaerolineae bacterium]
MIKLIFLVHVALTWMLVGLIWTIQVVHYPLFEQVGVETFVNYQRDHMGRITQLLLPLMVFELGTGVVLALQTPPPIQRNTMWVALGLAILIWLVTIFINAPQHGQLAQAFDVNTHRALVQTNWIRTIIWSIRGLIILWGVWQLLVEIDPNL